MEIRRQVSLASKNLITSHSTLIIAMHIGDIIFLTYLKKRADLTELKLPFFDNKSSKIFIAVRLKFL